jgi:hypothetical protein
MTYVIVGHFDDGKIRGPGKIGKELKAPTQQLIVNTVAKAGTVGTAVLAHEFPGENYCSYQQISWTPSLLWS